MLLLATTSGLDSLRFGSGGPIRATVGTVESTLSGMTVVVFIMVEVERGSRGALAVLATKGIMAPPWGASGVVLALVIREVMESGAPTVAKAVDGAMTGAAPMRVLTVFRFGNNGMAAAVAPPIARCPPRCGCWHVICVTCGRLAHLQATRGC